MMTAIHHRTVLVERFGGPGQLRVVDTVTPSPKPGWARVKVLAAGVSATDAMARRGEYVLQRRRPFTPGYELVGQIVDHRVERPPEWLVPGARVAACLSKMGGYTEYRALPVDMLVPIPAGLDTLVAAAIPLDYLTALSLLKRHAHPRAGDSVLIHGASGGVGDALCQLGTRLGLSLYGTASERSIARLSHYPMVAINYHSDVPTVMRRHCPRGVRAVFDHLGGANLWSSYRLLAPGGVLVSYAFTGRPGHILSDTVRGALSNRVLGVLPGRRTAICSVPHEITTDRGWYRDCLGRLLDLVVAGEIRPRVGACYPLAEVAGAHADLEQRRVSGKILLTT